MTTGPGSGHSGGGEMDSIEWGAKPEPIYVVVTLNQKRFESGILLHDTLDLLTRTHYLLAGLHTWLGPQGDLEAFAPETLR